ncbi:MAG TPA: hypothetical protein VNA89_00260 [Gemmatimonadaceae bacterium]|nr:hypothetical protein [Gemmatimonadaceae bacterium]
MKAATFARASGLALLLLLGACGGDEAAAPQQANALREGSRMSARAAATLRTFDPAGNPLSTRNLEPWAIEARVRGGRAVVERAAGRGPAGRARMDDPTRGAGRAEASEDGRDDTDEEYVPPEVLTALMPTIAVLDGEMSDAGIDELVDSTGARWRIESVAPALGAPVSAVFTYRNGALLADAAFRWRRVTGGWVLASQSVAAYGDGARLAQLETHLVDDPSYYAGNGILGQPLALAATAVRRLACVLGPTTLYAQQSCLRQGIGLVSTSFLLAGATVSMGGTYPVSWIALGGYLALWGRWTADLMAYTECRTIRGRFAR